MSKFKERKWFGFTLKKLRSRQYLVETIMDEDYADDLALLNSQLPSLKQEALVSM